MLICFCSDEDYFFPLAVAVKSVALTHPTKSVKIIILASSMSAKSRNAIENAAHPIPVQWIDLTSTMLSGLSSGWNIQSKSTYARLLLPELLPSTIERAIYIDADVIVAKSLQGLWDTELSSSSLLAAVYDAYIPWAGSPGGSDWRSLNCDPSMPYFNAGVLLIPLDRWRSQCVGNQALDLLRRQSLRYDDQCALNSVVSGRWTSLPPAWNVQSPYVDGWHFGWITYGQMLMEEALTAPRIIHFTGASKPWICQDHKLARYFYKVLDHSQWSGWRPTEPTSFQTLFKQ